MPVHSRPHLTTHNRSQGHSAVAAAAYRLGLRLLDRRTGTWHDYTARKAGEEIVAAMTVAPDGSPDWVEDPDELWNRVEESERRKDAQVARDYVVPVPLGLDDARATELARRLARYICEQLHTPVSIGIHRDADVDLMGNPKPPHQQGYHAHLLFPTRRILREGDSGTDDAGKQGFGAKLSVLSNRRTSAGIVEAMNREWSVLANELTAEAGLKADYDWRSYERLGIDRVPQPRLTRAQVALEKKGFFTRQGDLLRDIVVMSEVYKQAHDEVLLAQQEQARVDVRRECQPTGSAVPVESAADVAPEGEVVNTSLEVELAAARARGCRADAPLADRFVAHSPTPTDDDGRQTLFALSALVWSIQRALRTLGALMAQLVGHREQISRTSAADLEDAYQLDEARRHRGRADVRIETYAKEHKWTLLAARKIGRGERAMPRRLIELQHERDVQGRAVEDLKRVRKLNAETLAGLRAEEHELVEREERAQAKLASAVWEFRQRDERALPVLLEVLPSEQRQRMAVLVAADRVEPKPVAVPIQRPRLAFDVPRPRPG
ncbi:MULTISPECIES: MobA/MobL family protein [Luteibacter]|uniref:MobA/MobL family protein n=1 Tax=Luteibacter TaxID=242605 RepID=UPI00055E950B|nr:MULTISPECIES: MobA/MobL family protein [unclassified Luteibacter]